MVFSPAEHPAPRVDADRFGSAYQQLTIDAQRLGAQVDRQARCLGDMPKVADQAVGDVDHRLGARIGRHPTLAVRRLRNQMAPT